LRDRNPDNLFYIERGILERGGFPGMFSFLSATERGEETRAGMHV